MVYRHHAATLYIKRLTDYIYARIMTDVYVSATVGMSAPVGGMSATVGEMSTTVEKLNMI